jgi:hypothetical protein
MWPNGLMLKRTMMLPLTRQSPLSRMCSGRATLAGIIDNHIDTLNRPGSSPNGWIPGSGDNTGYRRNGTWLPFAMRSKTTSPMLGSGAVARTTTPVREQGASVAARSPDAEFPTPVQIRAIKLLSQ